MISAQRAEHTKGTLVCLSPGTSFSEVNGGGIFLDSGGLTLQGNTEVSNNLAYGAYTAQGGGVYLYLPSLAVTVTVSRVLFRSNAALTPGGRSEGGAVAGTSSSATTVAFSKSNFTRNRVYTYSTTAALESFGGAVGCRLSYGVSPPADPSLADVPKR
jgi:hypothetical protein